LRYSEVENGGYCLACALFYKAAVNNRADLGVLVTKPLIDFQKALEVLKKHQDKQVFCSSNGRFYESYD
jgi:hypothetical protein